MGLRGALQTYRSFIMYFFRLLLFAQAVAAYYLALRWFLPRVLYYGPGNIVLFGLYAVLTLVFTAMYGCYRVGQLRMRDLTLSYAIAMCFVNAITYLQICLIRREILPPLPLIGLAVAQTLIAMVLIMLMTRVYYRLYPQERVVAIVGPAASAARLLEKSKTRFCGYQVDEVRSETAPREELLAVIDAHAGAVLGDINADTRAFLFDYCYRTDKKVYLLPNVMDVVVQHAQRTQVQDILLYACKSGRFSLEYRFLKRLFDLLASGLALVVLSPVLAVTALAIRLGDGGPAIYRQTRLTRGGKPFTLYKFRSMRVDAEKESGAVLASKHDSRVTPVGRFIRRTRLDELPQLANILLGDMSFIGPRPERPEQYAVILRECPQFGYRLKVKAGLTGYAQLYGKYNTPFEDKMRLDMQYIESASIVQDLKLMLYTLKILFFRESTEGVDDPAPAPAAEADKAAYEEEQRGA